MKIRRPEIPARSAEMEKVDQKGGVWIHHLSAMAQPGFGIFLSLQLTATLNDRSVCVFSPTHLVYLFTIWRPRENHNGLSVFINMSWLKDIQTHVYMLCAEIATAILGDI